MPDADALLRAIVAEQPYPLLFATVSGAHLYGFPSPDSDYDLRGVHVLPLREVLGLNPRRETITVSADRAGLELDLVTHEVAKFCRLLLRQQRFDVKRIISCLRQYVAACIPAPARTEAAYWSVSCMPSTNASTWPRLACFNSNTMAICVVGHRKENPRQIWAFVNVANLAFRTAYPQDAAFLAVYPDATIDLVGYVAAGLDQVCIGVEGLDQLERLFCDLGIGAAARLLNVHLMRKRTNFFARFHCYDLADALICSRVGAGHTC